MLKFKKLFASAAAALLTGMLTVSVSASGIPGMVCVGTYLNMRSAGNTGAPIIGRLYDGAQITITGSANGWDKITYSGKTAWISGLYVAAGKVQTAVSAAESQLGVPYRFGAESANDAFDCSGLTMYVYGKAGIRLPHSAAEQSTYGRQVSRSSLRPGDLLFFATDESTRRVTHCGIYIGSNRFISAESGGGKVMKASLGNSYWSGTFVTARRMIG